MSVIIKDSGDIIVSTNLPDAGATETYVRYITIDKKHVRTQNRTLSACQSGQVRTSDKCFHHHKHFCPKSFHTFPRRESLSSFKPLKQSSGWIMSLSSSTLIVTSFFVTRTRVKNSFRLLRSFFKQMFGISL